MTNEPVDFKAIADATIEFNRKLTAGLAEVGVRAWKDAMTFTQAATAFNSNLLKQYTSKDISEQIAEFNSNTARQFSAWTEYFKNFGK